MRYIFGLIVLLISISFTPVSFASANGPETISIADDYSAPVLFVTVTVDNDFAIVVYSSDYELNDSGIHLSDEFGVLRGYDEPVNEGHSYTFSGNEHTSLPEPRAPGNR